MKIDLNKLTLKEKIGQMIGLAFGGTEYSEELAMQVEEIGAGLIIYFKDNCESPEQIFNLNKKINEHAKIAPFIALDQEGGMVARVTKGVVQTPGAMAISAGSTPKDCFKLCYNMGKELRKIGFNFNFAPVGDIQNNPKNPVINVRSYSEKPEVVTEYVIQAVKGYEKAKMLSSVKHFPGHGDTGTDSHLGLPVVDYGPERLKKMELVPFQACVDYKLPGIMASHMMYNYYDNKYPSTLSEKVITGLLRKEMGYNGLVVTDSLTMKAVWGRYSMEEIVFNTFNSGCDILLLCGARDINSQKEFAETAYRLASDGKISMDKINLSVERILKYKEKYHVGKMPKSFDSIKNKLENKKSVNFAQEVANRSITLVKDDAKLLPVTKEDKTLIIFPIIKVVTLVENGDNTLNSLADYFDFKVDKLYATLDPTEEEKAKILEASKNYDKVIYCSYNASFNPNQQQLINQLDKDKLIVAAVRTPYDYNCLDVKTYLCSYEASVQAFIALEKALTGKIEIKGVLPVTLDK